MPLGLSAHKFYTIYTKYSVQRESICMKMEIQQITQLLMQHRMHRAFSPYMELQLLLHSEGREIVPLNLVSSR